MAGLRGLQFEVTGKRPGVKMGFSANREVLHADR
jgi:hypothetical protein